MSPKTTTHRTSRPTHRTPRPDEPDIMSATTGHHALLPVTYQSITSHLDSRTHALEVIASAREGEPRVYLGTREHAVLIRYTDVPPRYWDSVSPRARWTFLTEYTYA